MGTVFQGFWHGPPLSLVHRACLHSFVRRGHNFDLYAYDAIDAGPGVTIRDAAEIIAREELFYFSDPSTGEKDIAPFSDLFRLKLLLEKGGWWCDVDTVCLADFIPEWQYAWTRDNPEAFPELAANATMAFPKGDRIVQELWNRCDAERATTLQSREQFGAFALTRLLSEAQLPLEMAAVPETFFPLRWIEMFKLWLPQFAEDVRAKSQSSLFLPIFFSFAKRLKIDFDRLPPENSFLHQIVVDYYLDRGEIQEGYTEEFVLNLVRGWFAANQSWAVPELVAACGEEVAEFLGLDAIGTEKMARPPTRHPPFNRTYWEGFFGREDPWNYENSYERAKYRQTLECLPEKPIPRALELACAEGHFSVQLAPRVGQLLATDISATALERARRRCQRVSNIQFQILDLLDMDIPPDFDLVVCSEVLYYLPLSRLAEVAGRIAKAIRLGGHLVMAHPHAIADERARTGFDWGHPFGVKTISETFSRISELSLESELRTPLYVVQRYRRRSDADTKPPPPRIIELPIEAELPVEVEKTVIWGGASVTRREAQDTIRSSTVPILMYHSVADSGPPELAPYRISPALFADHLKCLRRHGYHSISLGAWAASIASGTPVPGRPVIITFDDGYKDFLSNAWPALARADFTATVFAVTRKVGKIADWDTVTGAPLQLLDWDDLRFLQSRGADIASHGALHKDLTVLSEQEIRQLAAEAREVLGEQLGKEVVSFSFPWGRSNPTICKLMAECGYDIAVLSFGGASGVGDDPLALPRIEIFGDDDVATFMRRVGIQEIGSATPELRIAAPMLHHTGETASADRRSVGIPVERRVSRWASAINRESRRAATDEDVTRLYRQLLGREPESILAIKAKSGRPMIDVVLEFARSEELRGRTRQLRDQAEANQILNPDKLEKLYKTYLPEQNFPANWFREFSRILEVHGLAALPVIEYFHDMLMHQQGLQYQGIPVTRSLTRDATEWKHFGHDLTLVVPTRNSANWVAHLVDFYADLAVPVLFAVDRRTSDDTRSVLAEKRAAFVEVGSEHPRVESLLPDIVAKAGTDWILRLDDDELPSPRLLRFADSAVEGPKHLTWWFPRIHLRYDERQRQLQYSQFLAFGPLAGTDVQGRLFSADSVKFDDMLHSPGFVAAERRSAPAESLIFHFDWVLRSTAERLEKLRSYEGQDFERGRACSHFALYETIPESWHLFMPLADTAYGSFGQRIYRRGRTARS